MGRKILIVNPGATSTKIAVFEEERELMKRSLDHAAAELAGFSRVIDQAPYRQELILRTLAEEGFSLTDFAAVCGRGGLVRHIPSGTYRVNEKAIADMEAARYGEHASNLGLYLAKRLAELAGAPAFFVDPVAVDEMADVARVAGCRGMERASFFHALNHKSMARRLAAELGKAYEELNLIIVHLGGGVSVAAHQRGRAVDVYNVRDEGSFSMDRGGSLPVTGVIDYCFSGVDKKTAKKHFAAEAGVYSYLGTKDFREVEKRAFEDGEEEALRIFKALAYQLAKDVGSMAAVLRFEVDGIILTGGMAYSRRFTEEISSYVEKLAPVTIYAGEDEMRSLAAGALRVLNGEEANEY